MFKGTLLGALRSTVKAGAPAPASTPPARTLAISPYRVTVVPDAAARQFREVTNTPAGELVDKIRNGSVSLDHLRGIEDSEFFLIWDARSILPANIPPQAEADHFLIAQVGVYDREVKRLMRLGAAHYRFGHLQQWIYPNGMERSLARRLAIGDEADLYDYEEEEPQEKHVVYFILYGTPADDSGAFRGCIGKATVEDWNQHLSKMIEVALPMAKNTRQATLSVALGERTRVWLAEIDVSGGTL